MIALRKPEFWPSLFTICGVGLMLAMGCWQLQRLEWKEAMIARAAEAEAAPVLTSLPADEASLSALEYYRVALKGRFIADKHLLVVGRMRGNKQGAKLIVAFKPKAGPVMLVDRGWIPREEKAEKYIPQGEVTLMAGLRKGEGNRRFVPQNQPEKQVWLWKDVAQLSAALDVPAMPLILIEFNENTEAYPIADDAKISFRNDHLGYAITWFAIAAFGILIYLLYHKQKPA